MSEPDFQNRVDEVTEAVCSSLNISQERSNQVRAIVEYELIRDEVTSELKKHVVFEGTSSELLRLIRSEGRINE
jgi:hypothetical protein